jgi:hypothetical protein
MTEPFLRPRLIGERFEGHSIPLEVLKDLAVLEELIVEVAKSEFLKDHPNRRRSPRRFTEGISLKLTAIEEGSAIPVIGLFIAVTSLLPSDNQLYFERAREAVINAVGAAEQNQSITAYLPEKSLAYFDRLGRSLRDGEAIELNTPTHPGNVRLTRETRRKLVLASSRVKELTEEVAVRGSIAEVDQDDMTFELQLIDGRKIKAPLTDQHLETILEAFSSYRAGIRVLTQGVGRLNRTEKLMGFESVGHVSVLDPLDVPARLDELRLLRDGWFEGSGSAPSSAGIDWLSDKFTSSYPEDLPLPFVYPTFEGGLRLEWEFGSHDVTLDIDLAVHGANLHALDLSSDQEREGELNLDDPTAWTRLIDLIQQIHKTAGESA